MKAQYKPDSELTYVLLLDNVSSECFQTSEILPEHVNCVSIYRNETTLSKNSYDRHDGGGHVMYMQYVHQNRKFVSEFNFVWCVENDVYFTGSMNEFIKEYDNDVSDVLATQLINIDESWNWLSSLRGFDMKEVVLMQAWLMAARFKPFVLIHMASALGKDFDGFLEALMPNFCRRYDYSLSAIKHEHNSEVTVYANELCDKIATMIKQKNPDTMKSELNLKENIILHPVKLI